MAWVGEELAENSKRRVGRHALTQQRMRGNPRKAELGNRAGCKGGNALEPRTNFGVVLMIFPEQRPEQVDVQQAGYGIRLSISLTHTVLATVIAPLILITLYRAWRQNFEGHKRIARWTWPLWLYVSVTGVLVYLLLYQIFPQR